MDQPRLGVRFERDGNALVLYQPDGERFATYVELIAQREQARQRAERLAARLRDLGMVLRPSKAQLYGSSKDETVRFELVEMRLALIAT